MQHLNLYSAELERYLPYCLKVREMEEEERTGLTLGRTNKRQGKRMQRKEGRKKRLNRVKERKKGQCGNCSNV
jgi:hypothetical protein